MCIVKRKALAKEKRDSGMLPDVSEVLCISKESKHVINSLKYRPIDVE